MSGPFETRINSLELENFRLFKSLNIDFHPQLTVLTAPNGGGKTTILDATAMLIAPFVQHLGRTVLEPRIARNDLHNDGIGREVVVRDAQIWAKGNLGDEPTDLGLDPSGIARSAGENPGWGWTAKLGPKGRLRTTMPNTPFAGTTYAALNSGALRDHFEGFVKGHRSAPPQLPVLAYYRTNRRFSATGPARPGRKRSVTPLLNRLECYEGWSAVQGQFKGFENWFWRQALASEGHAELLGRTQAPAKAAVAVVNAAVAAVAAQCGVRRLYWDTDRWELFAERVAGPDLPVRSLSDGAIAVLATVGDLAYRCVRLNPEAGEAALKQANGVVLIDEIDLHLHPAWQQTVIGSLRAAFPKIQFIVTTHSPQVLSTVPSECIRILGPDGVHRAPPGTQGAEASRMLQRVFGVPLRPADDPVSKLLAEYLRLVDDGKWETPEALKKRAELDVRFLGEEPALLEADLRIENMKWERGE